MWNYLCHDLWSWLWLHFSTALKVAEGSRCQEEVKILQSHEEVSCHWYNSICQSWSRIRVVPPTNRYSPSELGKTNEYEACALLNESCFLEYMGCSEVSGVGKRKKKQGRKKWRYLVWRRYWKYFYPPSSQSSPVLHGHIGLGRWRKFVSVSRTDHPVCRIWVCGCWFPNSWFIQQFFWR